jgi:hypothetical protein
MTPDRDWSSVGVAGSRADGLPHLELARMESGTGWVVPWLADRMQRWDAPTLVLDPGSAAGSLIGDLQRAGVEPLLVKPRDMAAACGRLFDTVEARGLRHLGQPDVTDALMGAKKRPMADAWAWDRKNASVNISPVVALTLALWGHAEVPQYDPLANFLP